MADGKRPDRASFGTIHPTLHPGLMPGDECAGCGEPVELQKGMKIRDGELLCPDCEAGAAGVAGQ